MAARVAQLAGDQPGDEGPWDGQVQALLAQAGFALDWWRPVLDDVDLDWTLNHQAHLSADLARIASAGARILDQFAPAVPNPAAAPPSAVTEGPPQHTHAPRVAAAFGSVPATAIVDPLANSGRHRRPAYEFESFDAPGGQMSGPYTAGSNFTASNVTASNVTGPQAPIDFEQQPHQPGPAFVPPAHYPPQHQAPPPLPDQLEPELEHLFRPQTQEPPRTATGPSAVSGAGGPSSPIFGPPAIHSPAGTGPGIPKSTPPRGEQLPGNPPPPAFSRPIVWGADENRFEDEDDYAPIVRGEKRGPHASMVIQAVGILGAVAALCWWAATSLHIGSSPASHPAPPPSTAAHAAGSHAPQGAGVPPANTHSAHPATSAPAVKVTPSGVTPVTTPPGQGAPPPPNAADVTALQVQLLGGSPAVHQIAMILAVNTSGTGHVTVTVDYYGTKNGAKTDERTASWTLSGKTAYSIGASIPTDAYCGETVTLKATSGDATSTQTTSPGC